MRAFVAGERVGGRRSRRGRFGIAAEADEAKIWTPVIAFGTAGPMPLTATDGRAARPRRTAGWDRSRPSRRSPLALRRLRDVESFSAIPIYEVLAQRWAPDSSHSPFGELAGGVSMIGGAALAPAGGPVGPLGA